MDFTNRNSQPSPAATSNAHSVPTGSPKKKRDRNKWGRIGVASIVLAVAVLLIALVAFIGFSGNNSEGSYVDASKFQVVVLNNNQAYFGHIRSLNSKYLVLTDIYYLQAAASGANGSSGSSSTNNAPKLIKLGCEIHKPYDQMVINSDQVTYWENLQPSGKVAQTITNFEKDNPSGLKCVDQGAKQSGTSNAQNATSSPSSTDSTSSQASH